MVFMPIEAAQPSSRSMRAGSNVSDCHSSSWLTADAGVKLQPTSHGNCSYQLVAASRVHLALRWLPATAKPAAETAPSDGTAWSGVRELDEWIWSSVVDERSATAGSAMDDPVLARFVVTSDHHHKTAGFNGIIST